MRELPIIFNGPTVRAIIDKRKTQTRRVIKAPRACTMYGRRPLWDKARVEQASPFDDQPYLHLPYTGGDMQDDVVDYRLHSPWRIGDLLWVRERMYVDADLDVYFAADDAQCDIEELASWQYREPEYVGGIPSIHMPKWAARIWLRVTDVRVERVQDISEDDAYAEGYKQRSFYRELDAHQQVARATRLTGLGPSSPAKKWFADVWDSINAKRGYGWGTNPWVWVIQLVRDEAYEIRKRRA